LQAAAVAACGVLLSYRDNQVTLVMPVHLAAFFLTALMCHQALVARRPDPARLTEFYFWMSLGGVVGGSFNAFLAPVIFDNVWEYPLVLALACLFRPRSESRMTPQTWMLVVLGLAGAAATLLLNAYILPHVPARPLFGELSKLAAFQFGVKICLAAAVIGAFLIRSRPVPFFAVIALLSVGANVTAAQADNTHSWRSFFGVLRQSDGWAPVVGGRVRMLFHGTTLHGAQAADPRFRCTPLVYYAASTPIGQVFQAEQAAKSALRIGAVGLGTGSVSAYVRATDRLTFFEIDPLVIRTSSDPTHFSYTTECAKGPVDYVLGDARLTLAKQPAGLFDVLLIDAFSSDAVPTHLLTTEAVRGYLTHLTPDGVLILHLSNRNLDLKGPAQAVAKAAGGAALIQDYETGNRDVAGWASSEDAVVIGRSPQALALFSHDPRWKPTRTDLARPWTDDYTNLFGALWRRTLFKFHLRTEG
jgi:hypothetical protein